MTLTPPWYQPCTMMSRPGTGISPPLCETQFSSAVCAVGILKYACCVYFPFASIERIVLPPISIIELAWHIGDVPPPHSSVNTTFLPSLLKTAVCHSEKFVSDLASRRTGFSGLETSTSNP